MFATSQHEYATDYTEIVVFTSIRSLLPHVKLCKLNLH